jgi:hypothetical protein
MTGPGRGFARHGRKALVLATTLFASVLLTGAATPGVTPAPEGTFVVLQPATMTKGLSHTYVVDTVVESDIPDGTSPERSRRVFRLEVLQADNKRILLGYTILSYDGAAFPQLAQAMIGRRFEYEASASGYPTRLTNWPERRTEVAKALDSNGGSALIAALLGVPEERVPELVLNDTVAVASMQSWLTMAKPRIDDEPRVPAPGVRLLSYKEMAGLRFEDCTFAIRRVTEIDPKSEYAIATKAVERLETFAFVSMVDGWVISLEESARRVRDGRNETVSKTITRQARSSACTMQTFQPGPKK